MWISSRTNQISFILASLAFTDKDFELPRLSICKYRANTCNPMCNHMQSSRLCLRPNYKHCSMVPPLEKWTTYVPMQFKFNSVGTCAFIIIWPLFLIVIHNFRIRLDPRLLWIALHVMNFNPIIARHFWPFGIDHSMTVDDSVIGIINGLPVSNFLNPVFACKRFVDAQVQSLYRRIQLCHRPRNQAPVVDACSWFLQPPLTNFKALPSHAFGARRCSLFATPAPILRRCLPNARPHLRIKLAAR